MDVLGFARRVVRCGSAVGIPLDRRIRPSTAVFVEVQCIFICSPACRNGRIGRDRNGAARRKRRAAALPARKGVTRLGRVVRPRLAVAVRRTVGSRVRNRLRLVGCACRESAARSQAAAVQCERQRVAVDIPLRVQIDRAAVAGICDEIHERFSRHRTAASGDVRAGSVRLCVPF